MSYRPKLVTELRHERTARAKLKILKEAHRKGFVTTARAREIGRWDRSDFYLNEMVKAGVLVHQSFNKWAPSPEQLNRKRGRPRHLEL
jgi:hypothetical protein